MSVHPVRIEGELTLPLSRWLWLVKWFLLIPHLGFGGVVGVLMIVVAILLLFKTQYRQDVFDLVMGFNRYVMRVCAYVALMTPVYPPFRFDPGALEPEPSGGTGPSLPPVAPTVAG